MNISGKGTGMDWNELYTTKNLHTLLLRIIATTACAHLKIFLRLSTTNLQSI